jgi:hypothetical protein
MRLFIGNVTPQNHVLMYRMPESDKIVQRPIQAGTQIEIGGELGPEVVDSIVAQHAPYGMIPVSEMTRVKRFHGLCYSIDKPIPRDKLTYLRDHNMGELEAQGRELRRTAAIAGNEFMETMLRENDRPERIEEFDLFVQEDRDADSPLPQISEKIVVSRDPERTPSSFTT